MNVGQVHLQVERYIDKVHHVPGDSRRKNQIKLEVVKTEDKTENHKPKTEDQKMSG